MSDRIRVVVVDDSPFVCRLLSSYVAAEPDMEVVGTAHNGEDCIELVKKLRPDVVTLDLEMPGMNGLAALERIMAECPTPVIIITGASRRAAEQSAAALRTGAIDFVLKYNPVAEVDPEILAREIVFKVRAGSKVQVIRALRSKIREATQQPLWAPPATTTAHAIAEFPGLVVIGASTGGPLAIRDLLGSLPANFPWAVVVVQHMPPTFTGIFAEQLDRMGPLRVKEAAEGDRLSPKCALIAPGDFHLLLRADSRVELNQGPKIGGHRPSIDVTMQSAAHIFGSKVKGVVLTGMGDDGTLGLLAIHSRGGKTFAQDAQSCVIDGMPMRAVERGVVDHVASPTHLARLLTNEVMAS